MVLSLKTRKAPPHSDVRRADVLGPAAGQAEGPGVRGGVVGGRDGGGEGAQGEVGQGRGGSDAPAYQEDGRVSPT